jgi:hypothetical protein
MTPGEKAKHKYLKRRAYQDAYNRKRKENETPEQKEKRLEYQRIYQQVYQQKRKENETPEQKEKRLKYHREYKRKLREMRRRVINRPNNTSFPLAQKEVVELPKINPDNNKYRKVVKKAAQAYRALSPDEKLERIRIAYRGR